MRYSGIRASDVGTEAGARTKRVRRRVLAAVTAAVFLTGISGLLLFLPPFSIWPLFPATLFLHRLSAFLVLAPFLGVLLWHGGGSLWRKGWQRKSATGIGLGVLFLLSFTSGWFMMGEGEPGAWLDLLHMLLGMASLSWAIWHALSAWRRSYRQRSGDE